MTNYNIDSRSTDITLDLYNNEHGIELIESIVLEAERIFKLCGASDDFCFQHATNKTIVFGGTNRLIWSAKKGFRVDQSSCTSRFLLEWTKYKLSNIVNESILPSTQATTDNNQQP
jgi:hypothetical protein